MNVSVLTKHKGDKESDYISRPGPVYRFSDVITGQLQNNERASRQLLTPPLPPIRKNRKGASSPIFFGGDGVAVHRLQSESSRNAHCGAHSARQWGEVVRDDWGRVSGNLTKRPSRGNPGNPLFSYLKRPLDTLWCMETRDPSLTQPGWRGHPGSCNRAQKSQGNA